MVVHPRLTLICMPSEKEKKHDLEQRRLAQSFEWWEDV